MKSHIPMLRLQPILLLAVASFIGGATFAAQASRRAADLTPMLHVRGKFIVDPSGRPVLLHGYMQPQATWFNGEGHNYAAPTDFTDTKSAAPALAYFDTVADIMTHRGPIYGRSHGWFDNFVRFIGDGSAPENFAPGWDANGNLTNPVQFTAWMQNLVVPYINHCRSDGLYVVIVGNPSEAFPGGNKTKNMTRQYQKNLIEFWSQMSSFPGIKNADNVQFEICNEPIAIESTFGANDWRSGDDVHWIAVTAFMQPIVDAIRAQGADNIVWVPGLGWQGEYAGYATHPIVGDKNVGYAAHVYPAYGGAHDNAGLVKKLWETNYRPCADKFPMIITEMSWSPNDGVGYKDLFNGRTQGFGNAIKSCIDQQGNVSYLVGMVGDRFDNLNQGLANATLSTAEGTQSAFDWFAAYWSAQSKQ
jgi:endoglucanase